MNLLEVNRKYYGNWEHKLGKNSEFFEVDFKDDLLRNRIRKNLSTQATRSLLRAMVIQQRVATSENIEMARSHILGLDDNWDNQESPKFKAETINMAEFIATDLFEHFIKIKEIPPLPQISPSSNGSIEILYDASDFEVLLQVCEEDTCIISAEVFNDSELEAEIPSKRTGELIAKWLQLMMKTE